MYRAEARFANPQNGERVPHSAPYIEASIYERRTSPYTLETRLSSKAQLADSDNQVNTLRASDIWKPTFDLDAIRELDPILDRSTIVDFGKSQLLTEADEHAARSVISTHSGYIEKGRFMVNDFDMLKATENALRAQPDNPRIQAEFAGLRRVMEHIGNGKAQVILSPAKEGMTYGLGFVFIPGELEDGRIPITQKIILYDHEGGGMGASASIRDNLLKLGDKHEGHIIPTTAEAHIAHPLTLEIGKLPNDEGLVALFGSDPAKIAFAMQFREFLAQYAGAQMQEYGELLVKHSQTSGAGTIFERRASLIKDTVFAVGVKLAHAMRTGEWSGFNAILKEIHGRKNGMRPMNANIEQLLMNAAVVTGGTQCPPAILERPTGMDILGRHHLDVMKNYGTEWNPVTECVKCPYCQFVSSPSTPHFKKGEKWSCGNASCEHNIHEKKTLM